jgi:hypothetical protein
MLPTSVPGKLRDGALRGSGPSDHAIVLSSLASSICGRRSRPRVPWISSQRSGFVLVPAEEGVHTAVVYALSRDQAEASPASWHRAISDAA